MSLCASKVCLLTAKGARCTLLVSNKYMREDAKKYRPSFMKGELEALDNTEPRKCLMCPTMLPKTVKYYCSGGCMTEARSRGIYGKESVQLPT